MTDISKLLRERFGFDGFREGQETAVRKLLEGRSVLTIFPTGGGKSLCYQLPALELEGITVVISPLIALMKDQIDFLTRRGVSAARLDSSVAVEDLRRTYSEMRQGTLDLLYVAPEKLSNERFLETLRGLDISLLAVDEAHCISEWGHNFRPDYLKLARLARELKVGRVLALTATATPDVASDIARSFCMDKEDVVQTSFYRSNLTLLVTPCATPDKRDLLIERLTSRPPGPAIIYVTLQRTAVEIASFLAERGLPARVYHAGLGVETRHEVQDWFMASSDGIVCATIAFGMGIDKSDIRYIYHFNLPKGLESYAQEIGRAGRDGLPSTCELLACEEDAITLENFSYGDTPTAEAIASMLALVLDKGERFALSVYELSGQHDMRPLVVETLLTYLELSGVLLSTGPFFTEYSFREVTPLEELFCSFDDRRAGFLRRLFGCAVKKRVWYKLDVAAAAEELGESRDRILKALNYLEEKGHLVLKATGIRLGYRRLREPEDPGRFGAELAEKFARRESLDIERIRRILEFARHRGCYTRHLLDYFGEQRDPCGHCGWCAGTRVDPPPPRTETGGLEGRAVELIGSLREEGHAALAVPRQIARFLCGLTSPAASRARLTRDPRFGSLSGVPFGRVLELAEGR